MGIKINPFTGMFDITGSGGGGISIGQAISGADPNAILVTDGSSNLADKVLNNGNLLIGSTGSASVVASLTGTTNRVSITNGAGSITLSLPQDIHTGASPTFANLNITPSGGIDTTSAGTLAIGSANANVINIGNSGSTVNIQGTTLYENVTQLQVKDPLLTINKGGGTGSASNSGIEIEENSSITAYVETSANRLSWILKAPSTAGVIILTPGSSGFTIDQGSHNPVTIGTANGLSLVGQILSLGTSSSSTTGAVTSTDWNTFNNKTSVSQSIVNALIFG
jgi:hypothetical protein